jgi:aconitate hydratase
LALTFENPEDYDKLTQGDNLELRDVKAALESGSMILHNLTKNESYRLVCSYTKRQQEMLLAGGLLPYTKGE